MSAVAGPIFCWLCKQLLRRALHFGRKYWRERQVEGAAEWRSFTYIDLEDVEAAEATRDEKIESVYPDKLSDKVLI
jgi:hypothetical protein